MMTKEEKQQIKELLKSGESVTLCNETHIFDLIRGYNNSFCLIKNGKAIKSTKTISPIFAALEKENNLIITN